MSKLLITATGLSPSQKLVAPITGAIFGITGIICTIFSITRLARKPSVGTSSDWVNGNYVTTYGADGFRSSSSLESEKKWMIMLLVAGLIMMWFTYVIISVGKKNEKQFMKVYDDHVEGTVYSPILSNFDAPYSMIKNITFNPSPSAILTDSVTVITDTQKFTVLAVNAKEAYDIINNITGIKRY